MCNVYRLLVFEKLGNRCALVVWEPLLYIYQRKNCNKEVEYLVKKDVIISHMKNYTGAKG